MLTAPDVPSSTAEKPLGCMHRSAHAVEATAWIRLQELAERGMLASCENSCPEVPTAVSVKNMRYLEAVICESLRCFPPVPLGGSRQLDRDVTVGGATIPRGTILNMNVWALHYSKVSWGPDAARWRPERWLEARSCNAAKRDGQGHVRWVPFSQGTQNCLGQHLAVVRPERKAMTHACEP